MGRVGNVGEVLAVCFFIVMILGSVLGQPVLLAFVTTGSMQPTLDPGDGYVALPASLAGPVEEGDVITFHAEKIQGGGLTTHRVVGETDQGFVTKGDNNPFTDQDGGEPPVGRGAITAVAWQPGGSVAVIPELGTAVTGIRSALEAAQVRIARLAGTGALLGTQGLAYIVVGICVVGYIADLLLRDKSKEVEERSARDSGTGAHLFVILFSGLVILGATTAMAVPAGPQEFAIVSAEEDSPGPRVIETSTSESATYVVSNSGILPVVTYLQPATDGVAVDPTEIEVGPREAQNATLTLTAPPETGYYRLYLVEHRYLHVLPEPTIRALYEVHAWLPVVVIDALLGGLFYLLGITLVGTGWVKSRSRDGARQGILSRLS